MADNNVLKNKINHRLTQSQKEANNYAYYKNTIDLLEKTLVHRSGFSMGNTNSQYHRMKMNYDLYNNKIDVDDYKHVTTPMGDKIGRLPTNFSNRDISSSKLKRVVGMEMKRPFKYKVLAVNEEATTRKEEEHFRLMREMVQQSIMAPIQEQIEQEALQASKGRSLSAQEKEEIQKQIQEQIKLATPDSVRRYMSRKHQDPAEVQGQHVINDLVKRLDVQDKLVRGWMNLILAGVEIHWVGQVHGLPDTMPGNPIGLAYEKSPDSNDLSKAQNIVMEYRLTPSDVMHYYGSDLKNKDIDKLFAADASSHPSYADGSPISDSNFDWWNNDQYGVDNNTIRVVHATWFTLGKIGFLKYFNEEGEQEMKIVDDTYKLRVDLGDISIEWEWIREVHQAVKLGKDTYIQMGRVPNQYRDIDNVYESSQPYVGIVCDDYNSEITSLADRVRDWQYYYNIIMYKIENLVASDKGKKLFANIHALPDSANIDTPSWLYFLEANNIAFVDPTQEGNKMGDMDITKMFDVKDLSLASDINNYINLAMYIERKCGETIGITDQVEGLIKERESSQNVQTSIKAASDALEPYFFLHAKVKRELLTKLLEQANISYSINPPKYIQYVLDDLDVVMYKFNKDLSSASKYGIYIEESSRTEEAIARLNQHLDAAIQKDKISMSSVAKIMRTESIHEIEEFLAVEEQKAQEHASRLNTEKEKLQAQIQQEAQDFERDKWAYDRETKIIEHREKRKTELAKAAIVPVGFDENKDRNNNNVVDSVELAEHFLKRDELEYQKSKDHADRKLKEKEIAAKKKTSSQ